MIKFKQNLIPYTQIELENAITQYKARMAEWKLGAPPVIPEHPVVAQVLMSGGTFELISDDDPTLPPYSFEQKQKIFTDEIQRHLDKAAQAKGYDNIFTAVSYQNDPNAAYAAEAAAYRDWRSQVWQQATAMLTNVQLGLVPEPTVREFLALLPPPPA